METKLIKFVQEIFGKVDTVEEYKKITNYENTKKVLKEIKLEIPEVPNINEISKFSIKRDEKILKEIIKPKDDLIKELYKDNLSLHKELSKQSKVVDESVKYQKERDIILADNKSLHSQVENIKTEYKEKEFDLEWNYKKQIKKLEKKNNHLHKIIDKFYETVNKFIKWICYKFGIGESNELIKNFQEETHTFIDPVKQLEHEEIEKEWNLER